MKIVEIIVIALALAMDAFAVSLASGVVIKHMKVSYVWLFGTYFGIFQFGMTLLGWLIGRSCASYLSHLGPSLAFILLVAIGCNMIIEGFNRGKVETAPKLSDKDIVKWTNMTALSIATSIDALVVGVSFAIISKHIIQSSIIIGLFAFVLSAIGVIIGHRLNKVFKGYAEIVGGAILIAIAIKILVESFL